MTSTPRRYAAAARRRLARLAPDRVRRSPAPEAPPPVIGLVEQFSRRLAVGWVSVPKDHPPVKLTLHLGPVQVASTYATPGSAMSGSNSVLRGNAPKGKGKGEDKTDSATGELVHKWQAPNIESPSDDRRNSGGEIRTFSFRLRGIWPYARKRNRVTIRVDDRPLPIYGHGTYLVPPRNGKHTPADLRKKFDEGYLLGQTGKLQLSKKLDEDWQRRVMHLYDVVRGLVQEEFGYDVFFIYGTLLGAIREGGHIGHDVDMDVAFVSKHSRGPDAATELQQIGLKMVERGLDVRCMASALHISEPSDHDTKIDLFHTFFDESGLLSFPFGYAGTTEVKREDWQGTKEIDFPGGRGLVPVNAEQVVSLLYGSDWRSPKPGFNWNLDRRGAAKGGLVSAQEREKVYWANFYAHMEYTEGSTFFEFVNAQPDMPQHVLDIGCGDGRDSCAFGAAGRTVLGMDRSAVAIDHAGNHAEKNNVADHVDFEVCDVSDAESLAKAFTSRIPADDPVMFYLRFFLHSIPADVQETLLESIREHARPGDVFAAEFRTDKDEETTKVHGKHYRRFQNAAEFSKRLVDGYGFTVVHEEEGTGLSPYKGEDPVLYRVIARR
jgi:ubiquinone/menaquinone biosynthesis C-methylase UbiE